MLCCVVLVGATALAPSGARAQPKADAGEGREVFVADTGFWAATGVGLALSAGAVVAGSLILALPDRCVDRFEGRCAERSQLTTSGKASAGVAVGAGTILLGIHLWLALFAPKMSPEELSARADSLPVVPDVAVGKSGAEGSLRLRF